MLCYLCGMGDDKSKSGWTVDTLLALMNERDKRYEQNRIAVEKALELADVNTEKWRASANEWREAMNDRERKFVTKEIGVIVALLSMIGFALAVWEALHK